LEQKRALGVMMVVELDLAGMNTDRIHGLST
jgi:hypothetical protein